MNRDILTSRVAEILGREAHIDPKNIHLTTQLSDLGLDSLDMMKAAVAFEKSFNVSISTDELLKIKTLEDVVEGIELKLAAPGESTHTDADKTL